VDAATPPAEWAPPIAIPDGGSIHRRRPDSLLEPAQPGDAEPRPEPQGFAAAERGYPAAVRDAYQEQLDRLANGLADMCNLVAEALDNATRALLRADLRLAEQVITDDARIDDLRTAAEQQAFTLLVLQAPVATDLRIVVSGLHAASALERMGDLALHIARAARRRHPDLVMPAEVAPYLAEMGRVGSAMAREAGQVIRTRDLERAIEIEAADDAMDDLHRHLFTMLLNPTWPHGIGPAIDITLIGRFYERYADHAVALARQIVYVVTGQMPDPITA
jgi:phosphate transport system protein